MWADEADRNRDGRIIRLGAVLMVTDSDAEADE